MRQFLNKTTCETKWFDGIPKGPEWVEIPNGAEALTGSWDLCLWWKGSECFCNQLEDKFRPSNWIDFEDYLSQYANRKDSPKLLWEKKMKEYLVKDKQTGKYYIDNNPANYDEAIEIPEGAEIFVFNEGVDEYSFYKEDANFYCLKGHLGWAGSKWTMEELVSKPYIRILWQRQPENSNPLFDVSWFEGDLKEKKHNHYFKNVKHLEYLDVYRVLDLFEVVDPCIQHAIKKLLCAGMRGAKNQPQDVQEAIDSLVRYQEMRKEDRK